MPRRAKPLSDVDCRNLKPDPTGETRTKVHDGGGLLLEALSTGRKVWRWKYAKPSGGESMATFGEYPAISLARARAMRADAIGMLSRGLDPNEERARREAVQSAEAAAGTFEAVMRAWAEDELANVSPTYRANSLKRLERHAVPYIGRRPLAEIHPVELVPLFDRIKATGKEETARRVRSLMGQMFRWAIRRGLCTIDPTQAFKGEKRTKPRGHFAALTDPADVRRLAVAVWEYRGTAEVCALSKLSMMLFQRPGELRAMQWPELDLDRAEWRYTVSKTKTAHIVPLPVQAVAILRELQPLTDRPSDYRPDLPRYVFPSPKTRTRPASENAVRQALRNMGFANDEQTPHGFRATARSLLAELGWKTDAIERQLAHKVAGPLGAAYDRAQFLEERRQMMQAWADYLDSLRHGESKVTPIRGRAA